MDSWWIENFFPLKQFITLMVFKNCQPNIRWPWHGTYIRVHVIFIIYATSFTFFHGEVSYACIGGCPNFGLSNQTAAYRFVTLVDVCSISSLISLTILRFYPTWEILLLELDTIYFHILSNPHQDTVLTIVSTCPDPL